MCPHLKHFYDGGVGKHEADFVVQRVYQQHLRYFMLTEQIPKGVSLVLNFSAHENTTKRDSKYKIIRL